MRDTNKFNSFFIFSKLFYIKLLFPLPKISWWRMCRWRAVNFEIDLCSFGVNSDLRMLLWGSVQAGDRINWPLTPSDVSFFGNACNGCVWKQFRCLRLTLEACGAPPPPAGLVSRHSLKRRQCSQWQYVYNSNLRSKWFDRFLTTCIRQLTDSLGGQTEDSLVNGRCFLFALRWSLST